MKQRPTGLAGTEYPSQAHAAIRERLAEHVSQALPRGATPLPADLARHLARCGACREEFAALQELAALVFGDALPPAPAYPKPDFSFLQPGVPPPLMAGMLDALGRIVVRFSHTLLGALATPSYAGALRGEARLRQQVEVDGAAGVVLTVEVLHGNSEETASLRVECELPESDPLDQAGSRVSVRSAGHEWSGETDESGCIFFEALPLALLPDAALEIVPRR